MTILNRYILSLAVASTLTTVVMAAFGEKRLDSYFSLFVIEYLVITLVFAYLSPPARRLLSWVAVALFLGFGALVVSKAVQILQRPPS